MAYTPNPFAYSLSPFDTQDLTTETADILDTRDTQLTNYLQNETSAIKAETDSLASTVSGIISAPYDWDTWVPALYRGNTFVATTTTVAYFCYSPRLAFVNCEISVSGTTVWPGDQILRCLLPVTARVATRVMGTAMFSVGSTFYQMTAFLPDMNDNNEVRFVSHAGTPWFGQNLTGNPNLQGNRQGSNLYMNLTFYPSIA